METLVISSDLLEVIEKNPPEKLLKWLFLERHPLYPSHYLVNSYDPTYAHTLRETIGSFCAISIFKIDELRQIAEEEGYTHLVYLDDPSEFVDRIATLDEPYPLPLNVELKKFQLQGFNYTKELISDIINWSTGTGKSVFAVAKAKYLLSTNQVDKVVVASKGHNKINWQRQFAEIGDISAVIAESPLTNVKKRREARAQIYLDESVFIINYEKLRFRNTKDSRSAGDGQELIKALRKKRVYFIWDEMPTKLKNRTSLQYKGAKKIVAVCKEARHSMLSATPLEHSPEDIHACVTLMTGDEIFHGVQDFRTTYARSFNPFRKWQVQSWDVEKLEELGMRLAHMTHRADKYRDPEIRSQFPKEMWEDIIIDMSEQDRKLYDSVEKWMAEEYDLNPRINTLPAQTVMQIICNNPLWLKKSDGDLSRAIVEKYNPTDAYCTKLQTLKEMADQIEGKIVLFSHYNDFGSKELFKYILSWGHSAVLYDGNQDQLQQAQDRFKYDPGIKFFVTSDRGSDSINLEQATTIINYDMPWNNSTLIQRVNRINRITSESEYVWYFNLITAYSMEERKMEIIFNKRAMDAVIFNKDIGDAGEIMNIITPRNMRYILFGNKA